jgi:hypothetical protein
MTEMVYFRPLQSTGGRPAPLRDIEGAGLQSDISPDGPRCQPGATDRVICFVGDSTALVSPLEPQEA